MFLWTNQYVAFLLYSNNSDMGCKQQKSKERGKVMFQKLKEYYSKKQNGETRGRSEETKTQQPLHRGKLCQDISQKNKSER